MNSAVIAVMGTVATALPATAAAEPTTWARGVVDQSYSSAAPATPTGVGFNARYHASGDPDGDPPFMTKMVFDPPAGMRYDTSVPERCTANDLELSMQGPGACPAASIIGTGKTYGVFYIPFTQRNAVLDRYTHNVYIANNANEQIVLIEAEGYAVVRGNFRPDGSLEFASPTCFPTPPTGCLEDHVLQTATETVIPEYTRTVDGETRSYATTPPTCPASGDWETLIRFTWRTGEIDEVTTRQPCGPAPPQHAPARRPLGVPPRVRLDSGPRHPGSDSRRPASQHDLDPPHGAERRAHERDGRGHAPAAGGRPAGHPE